MKWTSLTRGQYVRNAEYSFRLCSSSHTLEDKACGISRCRRNIVAPSERNEAKTLRPYIPSRTLGDG
jgi:hypothetical protein